MSIINEEFVEMSIKTTPETVDTTDSVSEPVSVIADTHQGHHNQNHQGARDVIRNIQTVREFVEKHYVADPENRTMPAGGVAPASRLRQLMSALPVTLNQSSCILAAQLRREYAMYCYLINAKLNEFVRIYGRSFSFSVVGTKGGIGKTVLASNLAILLASVGQGAVIAIETNENDGTLNFKLGLERQGHPLLPEVANDPSILDSHANIASKLGKHHQVPVYAILSDPNNDAYNDVTLGKMVRLADEVDRHGIATVYDTGNGLNVNEVATLKGDCVVIPILAGDETSFSTALTTLINLRGKGHDKKLQNHTRIVITGTRQDDTIEALLAQIVNASVQVAKESQEPAWTTPDGHVQMMRDLGFDYDEATELFTGDKIDLVHYSQWIHEKKPASVLAEDTGQQTINDILKLILSSLSMSVQTDEDKQAEITRRLKEVGEVYVARGSQTESDKQAILRAVQEGNYDLVLSLTALAMSDDSSTK